MPLSGGGMSASTVSLLLRALIRAAVTRSARELGYRRPGRAGRPLFAEPPLFSRLKIVWGSFGTEPGAGTLLGLGGVGGLSHSPVVIRHTGNDHERWRNHNAGQGRIHERVRQRPGQGAGLLHERPWLRAAGRQPDTRRTAVPDRRGQGSGLPASSLAGDAGAGPAGTRPNPGGLH